MENESKLLSTIYDVIEHQERWYQVLKVLCQKTGAKKAILSLRDQATAALVIPTTVKEAHRSPMLYQFKETDVESFLSDYAQHDPWTEIERCYPSIRPYALSDHLPHDELRTNPFWNWLEPQGISDCVVAKIGTLPNQWVALNLYFSHEEVAVKHNILATMKTAIPHLKKAWKMAETVREAHLVQDRSRYFLEQYKNPAVMLKRDGHIIATNQKAKNRDNWLISLLGLKVAFRSQEDDKAFQDAMSKLDNQPDKHKQVELIISDYALTLSLIGDTEDHLGADKSIRLLVIKRCGNLDTVLSNPIWENPILTDRESELVKHLANDGEIQTFNGKNGDGRWRKIKSKLGMEHPREVFRTHLIYKSYQNNG